MNTPDPTHAPAQAKAPVEERHRKLAETIISNLEGTARIWLDKEEFAPKRQELAQLIANSEAEATTELREKEQQSTTLLRCAYERELPLRQELDELRAEVERLNQDQDDDCALIEKLNGSIATLQAKLTAAESEIMRLQKKCIDSCIAWTDANDRATAAEAHVQRLRDALEGLVRHFDNYSGQKLSWHKSTEALSHDLQYARAALAASAPPLSKKP